MHCVRLALTQHLDVGTALVTRLRTRTVIHPRLTHLKIRAPLMDDVVHLAAQVVVLHLASNLVDLRLALFDSTAPSSQLRVNCSSHGTVLLLFSWSAGCVASLHSSRCSDPGFPVLVLQSPTRPCDATSPESDTFAVLVSCPDCCCCWVRLFFFY